MVKNGVAVSRAIKANCWDEYLSSFDSNHSNEYNLDEAYKSGLAVDISDINKNEYSSKHDVFYCPYCDNKSRVVPVLFTQKRKSFRLYDGEHMHIKNDHFKPGEGEVHKAVINTIIRNLKGNRDITIKAGRGSKKIEYNVMSGIDGIKEEDTTLNENIRPDIALYSRNKVKKVIEVIFTHYPNKKTRKYYNENNITLICIVGYKKMSDNMYFNLINDLDNNKISFKEFMDNSFRVYVSKSAFIEIKVDTKSNVNGTHDHDSKPVHIDKTVTDEDIKAFLISNNRREGSVIRSKLRGLDICKSQDGTKFYVIIKLEESQGEILIDISKTYPMNNLRKVSLGFKLLLRALKLKGINFIDSDWYKHLVPYTKECVSDYAEFKDINGRKISLIDKIFKIRVVKLFNKSVHYCIESIRDESEPESKTVLNITTHRTHRF